ncbi:MAG: hypothetical protein KAS32_00210 [Candidatus Peribacteraceae bacterium]|nr:hypothetical protein [Candidatus Peribacteraceae bacterium]
MYNKKGKEHSQYKHGMAEKRPYRIWSNMKMRCNNKRDISYRYYGAKGITYCDEWHYFINFWNDMKEGYADDLQIDRIDNNGNYCKENCRWVTPKVNSNNRSHVTNYLLDGEIMNLSDISKKIGINRFTLMTRFKNGWSEEKAFTTKVNYKNKNLKNYQKTKSQKYYRS